MSLLSLVSNCAIAEWVDIGATETKTIYADPTTIRKNGHIVKMWRLYDLKDAIVTKEVGPYKSSKVQHEFDCKMERTRILYITAFSGNMGKGKVVYAGVGPLNWTPVSPSSTDKVLWDFACK